MKTNNNKKAIRTRVFAFGPEGIFIGLPSRYTPVGRQDGENYRFGSVKRRLGQSSDCAVPTDHTVLSIASGGGFSQRVRANGSRERARRQATRGPMTASRLPASYPE